MNTHTTPQPETPRVSSPRATSHPGTPVVPRTLSTLNDDGSRHWINPRLSPGRFLSRRRAVAWLLIALYAAVPFLTIGGSPLLRLDVAARRFSILGHTFLPTDTLILALFMVGLFVTVFLLTAITGRVWCGWACPQTVYMEFVFRPIERFFDGAPGKAKKWLQGSGVATAAKYAVYLLIAGHLANTFLAYFVGPQTVYHWTLRPPWEHPIGFAIVAAVTLLMMFDFAFFREQTCLVACPYGRFQSVMLDQQSLIISYDPARGEPRGKRGTMTRAESVALPVLGDCVDCRMCVTTCPTGIDIRDGLQMECVNCAQCIDACDTVMKRVGHQPGLIRYTSQAALSGAGRKLIRPRTLIYSLILSIMVAGISILIATAPPVDVRILRARGAPFTTLEGGLIGNGVLIKLANRTESAATYSVRVVSPAGVVLRSENVPVTLQPAETQSVPGIIVAPPAAFSQGRLEVELEVSDGGATHRRLRHKIVGPWSAVKTSKDTIPAIPAPNSAGGDAATPAPGGAP